MESSFRCSPEVGGDKGQVSGEELSSSSWSAEVKVTCTAGTVTFLELPLRRRPNFKERPRFSKWPGDSNSDTLLSLLPWWNALRKVRLSQEALFPADPVDLDLLTTKEKGQSICYSWWYIYIRGTIWQFRFLLAAAPGASEYCIMTDMNNSLFMLLMLVCHLFCLRCCTIYNTQYTHWWWAYGGFTSIYFHRMRM